MRFQQKWQFDKSSSRRAKKALDVLDAAKWHLFESGRDDTYGTPDMDLTAETSLALELLAEAARAVAAADDAAQRAAKQGEAQ